MLKMKLQFVIEFLIGFGPAEDETQPECSL
jgi:hypothetical protein